MPGSWEYRVVEKVSSRPHMDDAIWYEIIEVYYDDEGKIDGTSDAVYPVGDSVEDLRKDLELMLRATNKPVISHEQPQNNLEYDLLNTQWITDKTEDDVYAQNLYAALCNNQFYKGDMKEPWTCSWRYAGGIVADMKWLATGKAYDYLNFYCSSALSDNPKFVGEGTVTDEVREDLTKMGWRVEPYK